MLHKLVFDTTDANTILDSANVGAYLRASDGTLLTHTDVGGKKALDVRVAEGINVEVDLTFAEDSVDVSGSIVELGATTLAALETITVLQGTSPWVVAATDLDIRALTQTDEVTVFQGTSPWVVSGSVTVTDAALANTAIDAGKTILTVAATAVAAVASPLTDRKYLMIYNKDNREMYIGQAGIDADGFPLPPGSMITMRAGAAVVIEAFSPKASHDMRFLQLS